MWKIWATEEVCTWFGRRDLRKGDHFEDGSLDWSIILKWIFKKKDGQ